MKLTIAYDGTDYCGWQIQADQVSIQSLVEAAFAAVTGERTAVLASGRTDAGVHAHGQVVSCQTSSQLANHTICRALNANLPRDIRVHSVEAAADGFHAIRDAVSKRYRYLIQNGGTADVFARRYCWYSREHLNTDAMQAAAESLIGEHDFASFEAAGSPRASTVRNITHFSVGTRRLEAAEQIVIDIEANGFLYNMARNLVGSLVQVGRGAQSLEWIREVLESRDRRNAGPTAPAHGLFLVCVKYATS